MFYGQEIRDRVSMRDLLASYGFDTTRRGRIPCPIHHGNGKNMAYTDKRFQCFVCGASGSVLDFVMQYEGVSLSDAEQLINDRFGLGLPIGRDASDRERNELKRRAEQRRIERERIESKRRRLQNAYDEALSEWVRLDTTVSQKAPEGPLDAPDAEWIEAVKRIDAAAQKLIQTETELAEFERRMN